MPDQPKGFIFQPRQEPREGAFTIMVPPGWLIEGGILRADLMRELVSAQNMEAKIDFAVKKDPEGSVMLRWGPEVKYCDMRMNAGGAYGFFPPGSNYQGMLVYPVMPAHQFLGNVVFSWAHPQGQNPQIVDQQPWPEKAQESARRAAANGMPFQYDAGTLTYTYTENGVRYKEKSMVLIEIMGQIAGGMWSNKETAYLRAPEAEFERWLPVLTTIYRSLKLNPMWIAQEVQAQGILAGAFRQRQQAEQYRAQKALETQRYIQDVDRQITEHRAETFAEIRNDSYLLLTGQEEYVNPYTKEVDVGSNEWNHRWVTENGDVFYSNDEVDNPNDLGGLLNRQDWKRTPIRVRGPHD